MEKLRSLDDCKKYFTSDKVQESLQLAKDVIWLCFLAEQNNLKESEVIIFNDPNDTCSEVENLVPEIKEIYTMNDGTTKYLETFITSDDGNGISIVRG